MGTYREDLKKYKDETWTKKDLIEGLKLISELTGVAGLGIAAGIIATVGLTAISGGLLAPWAAPIFVYSAGAVFQAYEEATPRQKFCMRVAGRAITGRFFF